MQLVGESLYSCEKGRIVGRARGSHRGRDPACPVWLAAHPRGELRRPFAREHQMRMAVDESGDHAGVGATDPLVGIGPNMVLPLYAQYREPNAVNAINPHLHNVPLQIAAERGLPALAVWLWFIATLVASLWKMLNDKRQRLLAATALAAVTAMLAAGKSPTAIPT